MIRLNARRMPCASLLLSLAAAFIFVSPALADHLEYDRTAIAAGEIWRLFSGHWVHYGFDHFFWDVVAFGFLGAACERRSRPRLFVCVIASALVISMSVWFGLSGLRVYRGLSGIDSALVVLLFMELWSEACRSRQLTWGSAPHPGSVARGGPCAPLRFLAGAPCAPTAIRRSQREQNSGTAPYSGSKQMVIPAACLTAFVCKVLFELATGDTIFVRSLESGVVGVPLAHAAGGVVGFLVGLGANLDVPVFSWLKMAMERTRIQKAA